MVAHIIVETEVEQELRAKIALLERENARMVCAERERDLAVESAKQQQQQNTLLQQQLETITHERDYSRIQTQRSGVDRQEIQRLEKRIASVLAICAVHHDQMGPYTKLALITGPAQVAYSAETHGGDPATTLLSMSQWNKAICGVEDNTNAINRALEPVEASRTVIKTKVDTKDGKTHWHVEFNENHLQHPRLVMPEEPRPNNGGNKRCPQCGEYCKKKLTVIYECVKCGIDYDVKMQPIDHTPMPDAATSDNIIDFPTPVQETILTEEEMSVFGPKVRK
jgi:hypothetical protein